MSEELDHKTFDLVSVLTGRDYPETSVKVYLDEKLGFTIYKLREAISEADRRNDEAAAADLQKDYDNLVTQVADAQYTVHMRGISEGVKTSILASIRKDFPVKRNVYGQEEENFEADQTYTRRLWAAVITRIEDPSGAFSYMNEALAEYLQNEAPKSAQIEINRGVTELTEGASAGFELAARDTPFLLTASPEG